MNRKNKLILGTAAAALVLGSAGGAWALVADDGDVNVTGPEADRATAAALVATGGGKANSVERDSGKGATWEVEVTRTDGKTVDVRLDGAYQVVVIEGDSEDEGGSAG